MQLQLIYYMAVMKEVLLLVTIISYIHHPQLKEELHLKLLN
jgi:hypothetical protein